MYWFLSTVLVHFATRERQLMIIDALNEIIQGKKENMWCYIDWFMQVVVEVEDVEEWLKCWIFENDLLHDHHFKLKIGRK